MSPDVRALSNVLIAAAAALVPLVLVVVAVQTSETFGAFDERGVLMATNTSNALGLVPTLVVVQQVTQPFIVHAAGTVVLIWVGRIEKFRSRALWAFSTMMLGWGLGAIAKNVVRRARPVVLDPLWHASGYSFPSGHALNIALTGLAMIMVLWPLLAKWGRLVVVVLVVVLTILIGADRVLLGVHFPSDVFAGWLLGAGVSTTSWTVFNLVQNKSRQPLPRG